MPHRMRRRSRADRRLVGSALAVGVSLALLSGHGAAATSGSKAPGKAAAQAITYAQRQIGLPYLWGGAGPGAFDCSGLVMEAYAAAGISIPRTSQEQWAWGPQVSTPQPGDLVFFAGADGTVTSPGHVGIVTGPHTMIEAYGTGYPIRYSQFGTAGSPPGDESPVGFTDPAGGRS
jgi:cell wall-associated NlpC family hydrolase